MIVCTIRWIMNDYDVYIYMYIWGLVYGLHMFAVG